MADWRRRVGRIVTDSEGQVGGVAVTVNKAGTTTKVTLKANKAGTEAKTNPFDTNAQGVWAFFVDVDTLTSCDYELDIVFSKSGLDFTVMNEMYENHSMIGALTAGQILEADFDATTFLYATVDDTPEPKTPTEVMAILSGKATAAFDLNGQDLTNLGVIFLTEQAAAEADAADKGQIWVKAGTPNTLWFTDDAGTDVQLGIDALLADGSVPLTANWDVGAYTITALTFVSDQAIGIAPFIVTSTTVVANLNASFLEGNGASAFAASGHDHSGVYQPLDAELSALAGLTSAANAIPYFTGSETADVIGSSADMISLLGSADYATARASLGAAASGVNTDITGLTGLNTRNAIQISPFDVGAGQTGEIRFLELTAGGTHYVGFKAPDALAGNLIFILPITDSTGTQALVSDGTLAFSWADIGDGSDTTAIHDDTAGEIVTITEKTTPVGADETLIEDSANSNNKKSLKLSNLNTILADKTVATTTIYVDSGASGANDGTSWTDAFTTIQAAIDSIPDLPAHQVNVYVRQGTGSGASAKYYRETVTIRNKHGLTSVAAITIQGHNGTSPQTTNADWIRITGADSGTDPSTDTPVRANAFYIADCTCPISIIALQADCCTSYNIQIITAPITLQAVYSVYSDTSGINVEQQGTLTIGDNVHANNNTTAGIVVKTGAFLATTGTTGIEAKTNNIGILIDGARIKAYYFDCDANALDGIYLVYGSFGAIYVLQCALNSAGYCVRATRTSWARVYGNCTLSNGGAGGTLLPVSGAGLVNNADASVIIDDST